MVGNLGIGQSVGPSSFFLSLINHFLHSLSILHFFCKVIQSGKSEMPDYMHREMRKREIIF